MQPRNVAVVGATGAVGQEFLKLFESRNFPVGKLKLLASHRSVGKTCRFEGGEVAVDELRREAFEGVDVAFFSAGAARSREFVPAALAAGALVVDNSSAYRMDPGVPLVIPEVNGHLIQPEQRLYPVANCSAIILLMAIAPLRKLGQIRRIIVSTYQSASGAGAAAMRELEDQTRDVLEGREPIPNVLPHVYAFNLFSHNTPINEHGYNEEEWKVVQESRKMLEMPDLGINVTCIRVPVPRAHSESITVEFEDMAPTLDQVRAVYAASAGVRLVDDRPGNLFPMPRDASGIEEILVGRIRQDVSNPNAICLFASGDQLLKGAALNALQIAERYLQVSRPAGAMP